MTRGPTSDDALAFIRARAQQLLEELGAVSLKDAYNGADPMQAVWLFLQEWPALQIQGGTFAELVSQERARLSLFNSDFDRMAEEFGWTKGRFQQNVNQDAWEDYLARLGDRDG